MKDSCLYKSGNPDLSKYPAEYRRKNVMKPSETLYFSYPDHFPSAAASVMIVMGRTPSFWGLCGVIYDYIIVGRHRIKMIFFFFCIFTAKNFTRSRKVDCPNKFIKCFLSSFSC